MASVNGADRRGPPLPPAKMDMSRVHSKPSKSSVDPGLAAWAWAAPARAAVYAACVLHDQPTQPRPDRHSFLAPFPLLTVAALPGSFSFDEMFASTWSNQGRCRKHKLEGPSTWIDATKLPLSYRVGACAAARRFCVSRSVSVPFSADQRYNFVKLVSGRETKQAREATILFVYTKCGYLTCWVPRHLCMTLGDLEAFSLSGSWPVLDQLSLSFRRLREIHCRLGQFFLRLLLVPRWLVGFVVSVAPYAAHVVDATIRKQKQFSKRTPNLLLVERRRTLLLRHFFSSVRHFSVSQ